MDGFSHLRTVFISVLHLDLVNCSSALMLFTLAGMFFQDWFDIDWCQKSKKTQNNVAIKHKTFPDKGSTYGYTWMKIIKKRYIKNFLLSLIVENLDKTKGFWIRTSLHYKLLTGVP